MMLAVFFGSRQYGFDDVVIACATAKIAFQPMAHRLFVKHAVMTAYHVDGGHDHSRRAKAALQPVTLMKSDLNVVQLLAGCQSFNSLDRSTIDRHRKNGAGLDGPAVQNDGAGATLGRVAADMGARQTQMIAQEMDKQCPVLDLCGLRGTVNGKSDARHDYSSIYFNVSRRL
jgi:hypothetical protein